MELPVFLNRLEDQGLHVVRNYDESVLSAIPATTSYAAFKVLQEGLTNALKYARPPEAELDIVAVQHIEVNGVRALVLPDEQLSISLLGSTFLSRLARYEVKGGTLIFEN